MSKACRAWPFSASEADMQRVDEACGRLSAIMGHKVSRSEFLRLCAHAVTLAETADDAIGVLVRAADAARALRDQMRRSTASITDALADLTPEQLAQLEAQVRQIKGEA